MKPTIHATHTRLSMAVAVGISSQLMAAESGFINDASVTFQARNYYFSRDCPDIVGANRQSKAELRVGELQPNLPVLVFSDIRLLPPSYQGASITSAKVNGLTLQGGHLRSTHLRNEGGDEKMQAMLGYVPQRQVSSDAFNDGGGERVQRKAHQLPHGYR